MNDSDAPPPPYTFTPPPIQSHQRQPPILVANPLPRDPNVPPPLPPRTPSFATSNNTPGATSSVQHSRQISASSPGATYSYTTGIIYPDPTSPRQDIYNTPYQQDYSSPTHEPARQVRFADNQQAEAECYMYPGSYRDPISPRGLEEKETQMSPPLPPRPPAAIATRGDHFAQPVATKPMAPPSTRLDPGLGTGQLGTGAGNTAPPPSVPPTGVYGTDLGNDPRTWSTQSIHPMAPPPHPYQQQRQQYQQPVQQQLTHPQAPTPRRRKLLLIYIHGFLGSTTSFNQFPAHVHNVLTCLLGTSCPTYTVHTKVYPRFKTRHPITEAAEMLSQWLSEFEDEDEVPGRKALRQPGSEQGKEETDIVLLGHSMGGLLAGEVVLLPRLHPVDNDPRRYRHRILGLVGFDTPFLGMHPGVVASGLSSLFRSSPKQDKKKDAMPTPMSPTAYEEGPSAEDLFHNRRPQHFDTGLAPKSDSGNRGLRNFLTKHSENLPSATMQYLISHMEFAACLADPMGLSARYRQLRGLEDGKDLAAPAGTAGPVGGYRVRFVNYYTVCYGRDKEKEKDRERGKELERASANLARLSITTGVEGNKEGNVAQLMSSHKRGMSAASVGTVSSVSTTGEKEKSLDVNGVSPPSSPGGLDSPRSSTSTPPPLPPPHVVPVVPKGQQGEKVPSQLLSQSPSATQDQLSTLNARSQKYQLPPIPPPPIAPPLHEYEDLSHITDQRLQKVHMKENKRLWKEQFRREKAHAKLVKEREKVLAKLEGKVAESPKPAGDRAAAGQGKEKGLPWETGSGVAGGEKLRVRKERKFCMIPKEAKGGEGIGEDGGVGEDGVGRDETWVKVPMGNVDEVGAHCGLFMAGTEIFEQQIRGDQVKPQEVGKEGGVDGAGGRVSMDTARAMEEEERRELELKRRQYERLVGDVAARIEGWVKEHVGALEAMEVAGKGMGKGGVDKKLLG